MERITFFFTLIFIIFLSLSSSVQADTLDVLLGMRVRMMFSAKQCMLFCIECFSAKVSVKRVTRFGVQQKEEFYPTKRTVHCTIQEQYLMTSIKFFFFFFFDRFICHCGPPPPLLNYFFSPLNRMGCRQTNKKKRRGQGACLTCIVDLMSCSQDIV